MRSSGLKWKPTDGYDAVDRSEKVKYQIKTRKNWTEANKEKKWWNCCKADPACRMGRFQGKGNYDFDKGIYVELDDDFEVWGIWELKKSTFYTADTGFSNSPMFSIIMRTTSPSDSEISGGGTIAVPVSTVVMFGTVLCL